MNRFFMPHYFKLFPAFSLIEGLITLAISVIALYFISMVAFHLQDITALNQEINQIQAFIYKIQSKARYEKRSYSLTISQNEKQKAWCLIAIEKPKNNRKEMVCDCLNLPACSLQTDYFLYRNQHTDILLKNKSLYPKTFINIDGSAGNLESKCLQISRHGVMEILQYQGGRAYVIDKAKRSQCKD